MTSINNQSNLSYFPSDPGSVDHHLAVHFFRTCRTRHWVNQEIFLTPEFLLLKVYATIANIGIDFIPSCHPSVGSLGTLPAAYINGSPAGTVGIIKYLKTLVNLDTDFPGHEGNCLAVAAETILGEGIKYSLFGHGECFNKFTFPIINDSMSRPAADLYLSSQRSDWINRDSEVISSRVSNLFKQLGSKIGYSKKFFFSDSKPSVCDIVLYSYLSVLLSIPEKFSPFRFLRDDDEDDEVVHRLKTFLLDFDDYLWQLSSKRNNQIEPNILISSTSLAAKGVAAADIDPDEETTNGPSKSFFGDDKVRRSNILFLGIAGAAMTAVAWIS